MQQVKTNHDKTFRVSSGQLEGVFCPLTWSRNLPTHRALCLWGEEAFKYSGETGLYYLSPSSSGPAQSKWSMSVQLLSEPAPLQRLISAEDLAWYFPSKGQQGRRVKLRKKKPHKTPNKQSRTNKWNWNGNLPIPGRDWKQGEGESVLSPRRSLCVIDMGTSFRHSVNLQPR